MSSFCFRGLGFRVEGFRVQGLGWSLGLRGLGGHV